MEILTPKEVARELKVTYGTVIRLLNERQIRGFKLGSGQNTSWRVEREEIDAYIEVRRICGARRK